MFIAPMRIKGEYNKLFDLYKNYSVILVSMLPRQIFNKIFVSFAIHYTQFDFSGAFLLNLQCISTNLCIVNYTNEHYVCSLNKFPNGKQVLLWIKRLNAFYSFNVCIFSSYLDTYI